LQESPGAGGGQLIVTYLMKAACLPLTITSVKSLFTSAECNPQMDINERA
jgi:hypothetical protein